jgi:hypothetical protein
LLTAKTPRDFDEPQSNRAKKYKFMIRNHFVVMAVI